MPRQVHHLVERHPGIGAVRARNPQAERRVGHVVIARNPQAERRVGHVVIARFPEPELPVRSTFEHDCDTEAIRARRNAD